MKRLRLIWQILTRKNFIVVTGNSKKWKNIDFSMPPIHISSAISRLEVELESLETLAVVKEILNKK